MIRSLSTAATGMKAQEEKIEQISNDMANMNTIGFKRGRTEFQDLYYQTIKEPGGQAGVNQTPVGIQTGSGARVVAKHSIHEQGPVKMTHGLLDMAISGDGFFQLQIGNGQTEYTRDGAFKMDSNGTLVNSSGFALVPQIQIPQGTQNVLIAANGEVRVTTGQGQEQSVGQIQLVNFLNPGSLKNSGGNRFSATVASGPPVSGTPGEAGLGTVLQGGLEGANVNPTESITDLITAQRIFEGNSRAINVSDKIWGTTNELGGR